MSQIKIAILIMSFSFLASCTVSIKPVFVKNTSSPVPVPTSAPAVVYTINTVTPAAQVFDQPVSQSNPINKLVVNFLVNSNRNSQNLISQVCNLLPLNNNSSKPCSCILKWDEKNRTNSGMEPLVIKREVQTSVIEVQPNLVVCTLPPAFQFEIPEGTNVQMIVTRSSSNLADFESLPKIFKKRTPGAGGDFQDINGNTFDNIMRYTCYDKFARGMSIRNRRIEAQNVPPDKQPFKFISANSYCVSKADGANAGQEGCEDVPADFDFSAESFYYNLFIPSAQKGKINQDNLRYKCPLVIENLTNKPQGDFWPLDSSFSLSRQRSDEFVVGVEAFSNISIQGGDASSLSTGCFDDLKKSTGGDDKKVEANTLVKKCLGFATKPKPDGTCSFFRGSNNEKVSTFRLRRFVALYPPNFDTDGKMRNEAQGLDVLYVVDRPVKKFNNFEASDNPFTMLGPKPCPFAYFDHKNVTGANTVPQYIATNSIFWGGVDGRGVNVDGIELPRIDSPNSCAAAIPLFNPDTGVWSVGTVHASNLSPKMKRVFIRPIKPWAPHYEEDTDFQACAPLAKPFIDPPLHFAKNLDPNSKNFNVNWCAEVHPTQNPNRGIDPDPSVGKVTPFTSHAIKNTDLSLPVPLCTGRDLNLPNYANLSQGRSCTRALNSINAGARHPNYLLIDIFKTNRSNCQSYFGNFDESKQDCLMCSHLTCDRTWQTSQTQPSIKFPLLAPALDVERALMSDASFGCTITFDDGGGKTGKFTPKEGCCGSAVKLSTGNSVNNPNSQNSSAHLEPGPNGTLCQMPEY